MSVAELIYVPGLALCRLWEVISGQSGRARRAAVPECSRVDLRARPGTMQTMGGDLGSERPRAPRRHSGTAARRARPL